MTRTFLQTLVVQLETHCYLEAIKTNHQIFNFRIKVILNSFFTDWCRGCWGLSSGTIGRIQSCRTVGARICCRPTNLFIGIFEQILSLTNEWNYIFLQISTSQLFIPIVIIIFPTHYVSLENPLTNWKTILYQKLFWVFIILEKLL